MFFLAQVLLRNALHRAGLYPLRPKHKPYIVVGKMIRYCFGDKPPPIPGLKDKGSVISVGNFDGVHLGHQAIVQEAVLLAGKENQLPVAVTFDPHPSQVVGDVPKPVLSEVSERATLLKELGIRHTCCLQFTRALSLLSAEDFCQRILMDWLRVRHLCVGHEFRLGYRREGSPEALRDIGKQQGFVLHFLDPILVDGERVSSTLVRERLVQGKVDEVNSLLGRPYSLAGVVVQGACRGANLGFPTANLMLPGNKLAPRRGVYATVTTVGDRGFQSVTNLGMRPTFADDSELNVETHLLDFSGDLYGERVSIEFYGRIRDEKEFINADALKRAVAEDIVLGRKLLADVDC